jgi:hypothetical protein
MARGSEALSVAGTMVLFATVGSLAMQPAEFARGATSAEALASALLGDVGSRLAHSRRVAEQAGALHGLVADPWTSALESAAWLHDIGYSECARSTGFHPLDGARWLRDHSWSPEICRLVAWHTRAGTEAILRNLGNLLEAEFSPPPVPVQALLTWADLTSSPVGERWTAEERLRDVLSRYSAGSLVHRATIANLADLLADASSVENRLICERGGR